MFELEIFGNSPEQWAEALIITAVTVIIVWALRLLIVRRLGTIAARTPTSFDDSLVAVVRRTRLWLIWLPAALIGSRVLTLPARVDTVIEQAAAVATIAQFGVWLSAALDFWIDRSRRKAGNNDIGSTTSLAALTFVGRLVLWTFLVLVALDNLGINVTAMIAGLGVGGVAVALAVQNILGDLFASLSIVIDKPFVIGDFIIVGNDMGSVEHVGLKTTRVRSLGGEQLIFSNSDLLKSRVRNYKRMRERRVVFPFYILYETPADKLEVVAPMVRRIIESQKMVRFDRAHFASFGEWAYNFEVVYWVLDPDYNIYMDIQQAINLQMVRELDAAGIGFAYPARKLHVAGPLTIRMPPAETAEAKAS